MLEIPEGSTVAKQLNDEIVGKIVSDIEYAQSPHGFAFYSGDENFYRDLLIDNKVDDVHANAGQVEIELGETRLVFNDGVNIRYREDESNLPKKHQLRVVFDGGSSIVCTVQMYGGLHAFIDGTSDNFYYLVAKECPSPLSGEFNRKHFNSIVEGVEDKISVKALLATEQRIPGLGNGTLQDILFNASVNPQSKLGKLDSGELSTIFESVKGTLKEMTKLGGRDTEKDLYGNPGRYETILSAKKYKSPCPVCGGPITKKAYLGGNVYYCENCQPIKK